MVEIDGSVQESLPAEEDNSVDESQNVHTSAGEEALEENQVDFEGSFDAEDNLSANEEPSARQDPHQEESVENESAENESDSEYSENFLDQLSSTPSSADNVEPLNDLKDPLGIQHFDKLTDSELSDGEYLYDVTIVGIDSADLKKEVFLALSDKRFALPVENLRKQVHQGVLKIPNLNPVCAMLIVLKTQELDVVVDWKQKHFTQATSPTKTEAEI